MGSQGSAAHYDVGPGREMLSQLIYTGMLHYRKEGTGEILPLSEFRVLAVNEEEARQLVLRLHWEERLTAADCTPVVQFWRKGLQPTTEDLGVSSVTLEEPAGPPTVQQVYGLLAAVQELYSRTAAERDDPLSPADLVMELGALLESHQQLLAQLGLEQAD